MFSRTLALDDPAWNHLYALYHGDAAFRTRVDQSAKRVLRAKLRWLLPRGRDGILPRDNPSASMRSTQSQEFFAQQALRSATVLGQARLPIPMTGRVLVAGQFGDYFTEAKARFPASDAYRFSYLPADHASEPEMAGFVSRMARADTVVVCVANQASAEFARAAIRAGKRLYVVSALNPSYALEFEKSATVVAVYAYARESFKAAFAVLAGDIDATGRLPIVERP